tara:strand:+ start:45204 stop:47267 length:2064 start_codon:yes stop_codon:yes gene_type:complete
MDLAHLRNVGIVAHIDAGKTTVTERILFYTGVEHRMGEVHQGNTVMDWMPEERERGITIMAATTRCPWNDSVVQIIDTPGHVDFTVEVSRSLRVLDGAVVVLCGVAGVQAQTETVLRQVSENGVPWLVFVNKMDRPGADFGAALESLKERAGANPIPIQLPAGEGEEFEGVLDLLKMKRLDWNREEKGAVVQVSELSEEEANRAGIARAQLCEVVAEFSDDLLEKYLEEGELNEDEILKGLKVGVLEQKLVPALCGSALHYQGIQPLLDAIVSLLPSPLERPPVEGVSSQDETQVLTRAPEVGAPFVGLVFKLFHDPHGDLCYLRVYSGVLKEGDILFNARHKKKERAQQLWRMHADHRERLKEAGPGEIVAIPGLKHATTGDSLFHQGEAIALESIHFPEPVIRQTLEPMNLAERDKLENALFALCREDPTLKLVTDQETGQLTLAGMGELHLEVARHRLERDFRVSSRAGNPIVAYRETLVTSKGGSGTIERPLEEGRQVVQVKVSLHPTPGQRSKVLFAKDVASIDTPPVRNFREGCDELLQSGGDLGFPLAEVEARISEIQWSPETEPISREILVAAASQAMEGALQGNTTLLEPVMTVRVEVPEEFLSGVLGDLSARRAEVGNLEVGHEQRVIFAIAPLQAMFSYSTDLRSLTQGRGAFSMAPHGYAIVPPEKVRQILGFSS